MLQTEPLEDLALYFFALQKLPNLYLPRSFHQATAVKSIQIP